MKKLIMLLFTCLFFKSFIFANQDLEFEKGIYSFPKLYAKTLKSTVAVVIYYDSSLDENAGILSKFWYGDYCEEIGHGSGFIFSEDGYILTNHHVVNEGNYYEVRFSDNTRYRAELVGSDERTDVAVLKVDAINLPFLKLETEEIDIGQWIYVIGNPLSLELQSSLSIGVVAGKGRVLGDSEIEDDIQLDIELSEGDSGSPVLNLNGNVIGMVKSGIEGAGIAFIIPNFILEKISDRLIESGEILDGRFGFQMKMIIQEFSSDLPNETSFFISEVEKGSSAFRAGLKKEDQVLEYNGIQLTSIRAFQIYVSLMDIGETLNLKIKRENKSFIVSLIKEEL